MNLSEYSVRRPVTVLMVTVSILVLGCISLGRLPLTLLPEYSSSSLSVFVNYPSSSPEEVERNITRPLEGVLSTLNSLKSIRSTSSSSGSSIRIEFEQGTNMDLVSLEIRDRLDQVRNQLPDDIERVYLRRWQTTDFPVFRFSIGWSGDRDKLYQFTEEVLRRRLERIDGVANLDVRGLDAKEIIIDLDENLLHAHGIDVFNLRQVLRTNNINLSGGYIIEGGKKYTLRTVGEFMDLEDISSLPLQRGRLTLGDVASVRYDFPLKNSFARLNGQDAVTMYVYKASTANVVSVCRAIREELEAIEREPAYSGQLTIQVFRDQSEQILKSLNDLKTAGLYGGSLAMVVLFLFLLKLRSTLIISLAIPMSLVFTFAFMYLLRVFAASEITLNIISLMGLMVAIGMLVDNSVVVLENIFRYKQDKGLSAREAALRGSREVGVAVVASTATTVVVFASFIFLPNSFSGRFTGDFGTAVAISLVASLIVALTLVPLIASRLFTGKERPKQKIFVWMTASYARLMRGLLRWRFVALILMAAVGYSSYVLFNSIDRQFLPAVAERMISLSVYMERSFSIEETQQIYERLEKILLDRKEELEIASVASRYSNRYASRGHYRGELNIYLREEGEVTPTLEIRDKILSILPDLPGIEIRQGRMRHYGGGSEMGVEVELRGDDSAVLAMYAEEVKAQVAQISGVKDVQTTLETGDDEIHLTVDRRKIEQLGLSSLAVARTISSALSTRAATRFKGRTGEIDIILQLKGSNEVKLQELLNLNLENRQGELVPLHTVVSYSYNKGPISIRRNDRKAIVSVVADTGEGGTFFISQDIQEVLANTGLPAGYSWRMGRNWRDARQSEEDSLFAVVLAIILMYIIMAALFESFLHPLTILFTVPFSIIGVALLFNMTNTSLSQNAYLGILILFGIVVNNGIILVDHINFLRRSGLSCNEAIVQGGKDRLRPILMTACTSLFGLLPLTLPFILSPELTGAMGGGRGRGPGSAAGMWAPVSLAVFGGLTTSTFLTLIILPSIYSYMDDVDRALRWIFNWLSNPRLSAKRATVHASGGGDQTT
ncbi:efflux RND transporter permease subunit, partial [Acidobacteria bacterium AH-259-G07]|nr:efflux RND transporter permease subunit [Acidobacteria bacterium AH-259-G07]